MSKSLDSDQNGHSIGPDVGLNCLQRLSVNNKPLEKKEIYFAYDHCEVTTQIKGCVTVL